MQYKTNWTSEDHYNAEDLNRVELGTQAVADLLEGFSNTTIELEPIVTNRDQTAIEFADDLNRIERNIERLFLYAFNGLIDMKTYWMAGEPFSFVDANRIEHNLAYLHPIMEGNLKSINYSGELHAGEDVI